MNRLLNWLDKPVKLKPNQIVGDLPSKKTLLRKTFKIAWPSATEAFLISIIGAVDMMMVGSLGKNAIAAVGITNQPKFILLALIIALNIALTVIVSRRKGEQDKEAANKTLRNALIISFWLSLTLMVVGIVFAEPFLKLAGAEPAYLATSISYLRIVLVGNFFLGMALTINAAQRGVGNTMVSMKSNIMANVVNVLFNYLLIFGIGFFPRLEVNGAATATLLGNIVAFMIATYSVTDKHGFLRISKNQDWSLDKETLSALKRLSSAPFIEQLFIRIGFLTYIRAVAGLGTAALASHQIVTNIMVISFALGDGLSIANSSLTGQSLGAKRPDLAISYGQISQTIGLLVALMLAITISLLNQEIVGLFTNDPELIVLGSQMMLVLAIIMPFQIYQVITMGALRGAGDVKFVAMVSLISVTFLRPALTFVLAYSLSLGLLGAWYSVLVDQLMRLFLSQLRYSKADWTKIKV